MKKYFEKHETLISILLIIIYIISNSYCMQNFGTTDYRTTIVNFILSLAIIIFILKNKLGQYYGLTKFPSFKEFLYFIPLLIMMSVNLWNGININNSITEIIFYMLSMICVGFLEEIIFRGFLFKGMAKDNLKVAILVSSLTFGVGHIVNIFNTADILGVLLQVCYATSIGFLYTIIFYKSGSLWPNIISHAFVNGTSVFASEYGPFSSLINLIFGSSSQSLVEIISALIIIIISSSYALWLYKKNVV